MPETATRYVDARALYDDGRGQDVWAEPKSVKPPTPPRGVEYPRDSAPPRPDLDRPRPDYDRPDYRADRTGPAADRDPYDRQSPDRYDRGPGADDRFRQADRPGPVPPRGDYPAEFGDPGFGDKTSRPPTRPPSGPQRQPGSTGRYPVDRGPAADGYWSPPGDHRSGPLNPPPSPPRGNRVQQGPPGREPGWSSWHQSAPESPRTEIANVLDGGEGTQIANVLDGGPSTTSAPDRRPTPPPTRRPDMPPGGLGQTGAGLTGSNGAGPNGAGSNGAGPNGVPGGVPHGPGWNGASTGYRSTPRPTGEEATELLPAVPASGPADATSVPGGAGGAPDCGNKYDYYADHDPHPADGHQQGFAADGYPDDEHYGDDYDEYADYYDDEPPGDVAGHHGGGGRRGPGVVGVLGELVLTLGFVVLLFVVYEVYWTDLMSAGKQKSATNALDQEWQDGDDPLNGRGSHLNLDGHGFAKLFVPKFGPDWAFTVLQGTDDATLESGPGHYKDTAMPGQPGDFAVAGHRVGKGSPFNDLGYLNSCDSIVIETAHNWYVYRVLPMKDEATGWAQHRGATDPQCAGVAPLGGVYSKTVGREIVLPTDGDVILPVPNRPDLTAPPANGPRLITLTTCHPQFSDKERMVIHGVLLKTYPNDPAHPVAPPELTEPAQNGPAPS